MRTVYVYVMHRSDGHCKVGYSTKPRTRKSNLQNATPDRLEIWVTVPCDMATAKRVEREAHRLLDEFHVSGEWFRCHPDLAEHAVRAALTGTPDKDGLATLFRYWRLGENPNDEAGWEAWKQIDRTIDTVPGIRISESQDPWSWPRL